MNLPPINQISAAKREEKKKKSEKPQFKKISNILELPAKEYL